MFTIFKFLKKGSLCFQNKAFMASKRNYPVKAIIVNGQSTGPSSVKGVLEGSKKEVETNSPLELLLFTLIACENATFHAVALEKKVKLGQINFKKVEAKYDTKGFYGLDPNNKFSTIDLDIEVEANTNEQNIQEMLELVRTRCPIRNMLFLAGVNINEKISFRQI